MKGMSWLCPHQLGELCKRMEKICEPGMKGCVLHGRVEFVESGKEVSDMGEDIQILDLRSMPPFERHEKIFRLWDELKIGQTLKITNDHDPKPLSYQFEVEYKGKYEWDYEQKGPKDWIVKIKKTG